MLIIIGYIVTDSEGRYLSSNPRDGFTYKRVNQDSPHVFGREKDAVQHAEVFAASGVEVKPVYMELTNDELTSDDPTDYISPEACRVNNI